MLTKSESYKCDKSFTKENQFTDHVYTENCICRSYKREICYKNFFEKNYLSTHKANYHAQKTFKCETCGEEFACQVTLKRHVSEIHVRLKNHKCNICYKSFSQRAFLKRHQQSAHEKVKAFGCDTCGKQFSLKVGLKSHILMVHEELKKFKCDECPLNFFHRSDLSRHVATVHEKIKKI